jgi:hypothetical protein
MFRTNSGFSFPYDISGNAQERAKVYSRNLWLNNKWPLQTKPLCWLVQKFAPVLGWHEEDRAEALAKVKAAGRYYCPSCDYQGNCVRP